MGSVFGGQENWDTCVLEHWQTSLTFMDKTFNQWYYPKLIGMLQIFMQINTSLELCVALWDEDMCTRRPPDTTAMSKKRSEVNRVCNDISDKTRHGQKEMALERSLTSIDRAIENGLVSGQ